MSANLKKIAIISAVVLAIAYFSQRPEGQSASSGVEVVDSSKEAPPKPSLTKEERAKLVKAATKNLKEERDKMEKISFFTAKNPNLLVSKLEAYLAIPDESSVILRVKPTYFGDSWVFFDKVKVMADDEVVYQRSFSHRDVVRDNSAGSVWETADYVGKTVELAALKKIADAKQVIIRFDGRERRHDHTMTKRELADLKTVLAAYESLSTI